jgi:predicted RNA-binding protein YlqC (UPF0109 family)
MIVDFIRDYIKLIVSNPDDVNVDIQALSDTFSEITIKANNADIGKIIGKNGNMINSIKTMANGCKAKDGISYKLQVKSI